MENLWVLIFRKIIYNDHARFMVSWWVKYSYFDNKQIQISDVLLMKTEYGSSG